MTITTCVLLLMFLVFFQRGVASIEKTKADVLVYFVLAIVTLAALLHHWHTP
jgi:hypothetical protein